MTELDGSGRLRLLLLTPFPPRLDAMHGGGRIAGQLVAALASRHRVALLYLRGATEPELGAELRRLCERSEGVERDPRRALGGGLLRRARIAGLRVRGRPRWAAHVEVEAFGRRLRETCASWRPDVVQLEYHVMGVYLPDLAGCPAPRVLNSYEAGARALRDHARRARGAARLALLADLAAWTAFERRVLRGVDAAVAFTSEDVAQLKGLAGETPVLRITPGVEVPAQPLSSRGESGGGVLFVGYFLHPPNVDAALRLVDEILPRVRELRPDARLHVVGPHAPARLARGASDGVVLHGEVADLRPWLDRAEVIVAPVRTGGGVRVKVLETLAAGKALVATPLALEGLDVEPGVHVLAAESNEEFARAVVRLLDSPEEREALGRRARAWAEQRLGWNRTLDAYERLYARLLSNASRVRSVTAAT